MKKHEILGIIKDFLDDKNLLIKFRNYVKELDLDEPEEKALLDWAGVKGEEQI